MKDLINKTTWGVIFEILIVISIFAGGFTLIAFAPIHWGLKIFCMLLLSLSYTIKLTAKGK